MQTVVTSAAGLAADTYILAGSGSALISIAKLVGELYGSKEMCLELIESVKAVEPRLKEMTSSNAIEVKTALQQYHKLLKDIHGFLETHVSRNPVARVATHWKIKKRVQSFYTELETIKTLVALDDMVEGASRHTLVMSTLQRNRQLDDQTNKAIAASVKSLRNDIESIPDEFAQKLKAEGVALVDLIDLKKELKTNSSAYSATDSEELLELLKRVSKALDVQVPHVASWYMSRSDICFEDDNPFATSELRELYHGSIYSGAKVTIKAVKASSDDMKALAQFNAEVKTWFELRDPHVLPLYGANSVGYPLVFVSATAELGNFRDYLTTHRHRVWQLFLDAARGLAYLHKHKRVHGNLKCNNLLVTSKGTGVVSDFAFAFVRESSVLSAKPLAPTYNWKAPECYDKKNGTVNPRFESDLHSLGMCLFEALAGIAPYAEIKDQDDAIQMIKSGQLPTPPAGMNFPDEAWELIKRMCDRQYSRRMKLNEVISVLEALAAREKIRDERLRCTCEAPCCLDCGRAVKP